MILSKQNRFARRFSRPLAVLLLLAAVGGSLHGFADSRPVHTAQVTLPEATIYTEFFLDEVVEQHYSVDPSRLAYTVESYDSAFFSVQPTALDFWGWSLYYTPKTDRIPGDSGAIEVGVTHNGSPLCLLRITIAIEGGQTTGAITGIRVGDKAYDGFPAAPEGAPTFTLDNGTVMSVYSYSYLYEGVRVDDAPYSSSEPPVDAGSYTLVVHVVDPTYSGQTEVLPFLIARRPLVISARDVELLVGDPLPEAYEIAYENFAGGEDSGLFGDQAPSVFIDGSFTTDTAGDTAIDFASRPPLLNYDIEYRPGSLVVTDDFHLDEGHLDLPLANGAGWYREDIVIRAAGIDGFDAVCLRFDGAYESAVTLSEETDSGAAELYLARGGYRAGPIPFSYRLDKTPPQLTATYTPTDGSGYGVIDVEAEDYLSGLAEIQVTGPNGGSVTGTGNSFPVSGDGYYTVKATDLAGNEATATQFIEMQGAPVEWWNPVPAQNPLTLTGGIVAASSQTRRSTSGSSGSDAEDDSPDTAESISGYWSRVLEGIREAADGTGVSITPNRYKQVPATVLTAICGRDVFLRIRRDGGNDILLHGKAIPALDKTISSYSLADLEALAQSSESSVESAVPVAVHAPSAATAWEEATSPEPESNASAFVQGAVAAATLSGESPGDRSPVMAGGERPPTGRRQSPAAIVMGVVLSLSTVGAVTAALHLAKKNGA